MVNGIQTTTVILHAKPAVPIRDNRRMQETVSGETIEYRSASICPRFTRFHSQTVRNANRRLEKIPAARDGLDKTIQAAVDGSCIPGIFPLISIPTIVGCIGAAMIIVAAVATPIAKSQRMREIWFYVMSSGVMLKVVVMELARIIQFI